MKCGEPSRLGGELRKGNLRTLPPSGTLKIIFQLELLNARA